MSYHDLSSCTLTADERREEAERIVVMLINNTTDLGELTPTERNFIISIADGGSVSVKQLFWLRDIKDKYL